MSKRFRTRKRYNFGIIKWFVLLILVLFLLRKFTKIYPIDKLINKEIIKFNIDTNKMLLSKALNYKYVKTKETFKEITTVKVEDIRPVIYLYSTHQTEEYKDYNIFEASKFLKKKLNTLGVDVILEETNIKKELEKEKLTYKDSYRITRELLTKNLSNKISLYIDLHRDSSKHSVTTVNYKGKPTAKIMFVVGGKHISYKDNYNLVSELNKMVKNLDKNLSRGIYVRKSSSYNQDLNKLIILIELGGVENTKEEVNNAISYLSNILSNYVKE